VIFDGHPFQYLPIPFIRKQLKKTEKKKAKSQYFILLFRNMTTPQHFAVAQSIVWKYYPKLGGSQSAAVVINEITGCDFTPDDIYAIYRGWLTFEVWNDTSPAGNAPPIESYDGYLGEEDDFGAEDGFTSDEE
jgi:hypothetical protein